MGTSPGQVPPPAALSCALQTGGRGGSTTIKSWWPPRHKLGPPPYTVPGMNTCVQVHACSFDLLLYVFARPELLQVSQEHVLLLLYHSSPLAWLTGGFSFLLLWSLKTKGLGFLQAQDVFGLVCCLFFFFSYSHCPCKVSHSS